MNSMNHMKRQKFTKKSSNNIAKEISVIFHNGSNYNYCFIIKELAKEFEREFNCLEKNLSIKTFFSSNNKRSLKSQ